MFSRKKLLNFFERLIVFFLIFSLFLGLDFNYLIQPPQFQSVQYSMAAPPVDYTTPGSGTWNVPTGVTEVIVELWAGGGGGAGGGNGTAGQGNGGGGGGQYVKSVIEITESSYSYVVAAGGNGGPSTGDTATNGGDSTFGGTLVVAKGGSKGNWVSGGGGTGGAGGTGGTSNVVARNGGTGGTGTTGSISGGGGGGAGTNNPGGNANANTAGTGGTEGGGNGGAGVNNNNAAGSAGNTYGGGGGSSTRRNSGAAGAQGLVRITYELPLEVGSAGTQVSEKAIGSTESHIGGAFTFIRNDTAVNVTSITITETGTVDANNHLSNLKLFYKTEATCSSTVPVDATVFNSTGVNFISSKATATGTMSVGTSQVCVYVQMNVSSAAGVGETILIEISNPSTEVVVSVGNVIPLTAVAISGTTTLIAAGSLSLDIVDGSDVPVTSPSFSFSATSFDWSIKQTTSSLGTSSQRIKVTNSTVTPDWTLSISASGGVNAVWDSGTNTYKYNGTQSEGRLEVNPSVATITPGSGCSTTGLSKESALYFQSGVVNSINIVVAGSSAETDCHWYIEGIGLSQDIPATQPIGTYSIEMTLTVI